MQSRSAKKRRTTVKPLRSRLKFVQKLLIFLLILLSTVVFFGPYFPDIKPSFEKKKSNNRCPLVAGEETKADITTKELYDTIPFQDIDGGAWKQGWEVKYNGTEWDDYPLQVFVVPHSHNDPGWILTVSEYYEAKTKSIITNIVNSLLASPERKFIWEEMSYLQLWWDDASLELRDGLRKIVQNGQLEIVGGGWVMNDEANSHYFAIIDQITEGNTWLYDRLEVVPTNSWAIDPFGHSPTMAYLLSQMGYKNMVIQRTHYEVKKALAREKNLEFFWKMGWEKWENEGLGEPNFNQIGGDLGADLGRSGGELRADLGQILCHMMPFYSYDVPHTCGPDPSICCQFDFARPPLGHHSGGCPWGLEPKKIRNSNVEERAKTIVDQWRKKSTLYKTNVVLVPLGDDFRYTTSTETENQFSNFERLFKYINNNTELKTVAKFGTLNDYFTAVRKEAQKRRISPFFPSLSGDFFTYADVRQDYWSGYYSSRAFYKAVDRVLEGNLRATEIILALSHAHNQGKIWDPESTFPYRYSSQLSHARRSLAVFQHHDGVTGTARDHVMIDYGRKMHSSLVSLNKMASDGVSALLNPGFVLGVGDEGVRFGFFTGEEFRDQENVLPSHHLMKIGKKSKVRRVVAYNSLEEPLEQVVSILVDSLDLAILDSSRNCVPCQLSPEFVPFSDGELTKKYRLHWTAKIPALGLSTFFVIKGRCPAGTLSELTVINRPENFTCPEKFECIFLNPGEDFMIANERIMLGFSSNTGLLKAWKDIKSGEKRIVEEEIATYETYGSGAYLFHPSTEAVPRVDSGSRIFIVRGPLMEEVNSDFKYNVKFKPVFRVARLYHGHSIQSTMVEMFHRVEMNVHYAENHELIVRYKTDLDSTSTDSPSVFYSDLNGFQMAKRQLYSKIPLEGNYYPMPALSFLQSNSGFRFSVHTRQAVGVASLRTGWLEMMLDRRLTNDDYRGLGQGVEDNKPTETTFFLLLEKNTSALAPVKPTSSFFPSLLSHRVGSLLNYPISLFFGLVESSSALGLDNLQPLSVFNGLEASFSPLSAPIPCDFHLVNLKLQRLLQRQNNGSSEPTVSLILHRRAWDNSFNMSEDDSASCETSIGGKVKIHKIFGGYTVMETSEVPLRLIPVDSDSPVKRALKAFGGRISKKISTKVKFQKKFFSKSIKLEPMAIKAFKFELIKKNQKVDRKIKAKKIF